MSKKGVNKTVMQDFSEKIVTLCSAYPEDADGIGEAMPSV